MCCWQPMAENLVHWWDHASMAEQVAVLTTRVFMIRHSLFQTQLRSNMKPTLLRAKKQNNVSRGVANETDQQRTDDCQPATTRFQRPRRIQTKKVDFGHHISERTQLSFSSSGTLVVATINSSDSHWPHLLIQGYHFRSLNSSRRLPSVLWM